MIYTGESRISGSTITAVANAYRAREPRVVAALARMRAIAEEEAAALARGDEIVAVPTLVRKLPEPIRKVIGDLSDTDKVLVGLQMRRHGESPS